MRPLFGDGDDENGDASAVPGLTLIDGWLSAADEAALLAAVDAAPWNVAWRRRRQLYGVSYRGAGQPFPPWLAPLRQRLADEGHLPRLADNATLNEYPPGVGIAPHADDAPFDVVCSVSLGGDIVIDFTREGRHVPLWVRGRSLWVATGAARWEWQHGIAPRKSDVVDGVKRARRRRVSLTFRTLR